MNHVEMKAAEALLDRPLTIYLPAPWLLRLLGKKTIPIPVRRPVAQNLLRISRLYVQMGVDVKAFQNGDISTLLECVGRNLVTASRILAHGMIRGAWAAWWLNRPLAYYLRLHMDMRGFAELTKWIVLLSSCEDFVSFITSAGNLRITEPTESQKEESGS